METTMESNIGNHGQTLTKLWKLCKPKTRQNIDELCFTKHEEATEKYVTNYIEKLWENHGSAFGTKLLLKTIGHKRGKYYEITMEHLWNNCGTILE